VHFAAAIHMAESRFHGTTEVSSILHVKAGLEASALTVKRKTRSGGTPSAIAEVHTVERSSRSRHDKNMLASSLTSEA
jgi:hypothetical protein